MLLDLYTLGLFVLIGRGFYIARKSDRGCKLVARVAALSPCIAAMILFQQIFNIRDLSQNELLYTDLIDALNLYVVWGIALAYLLVPTNTILGNENEYGVES